MNRVTREPAYVLHHYDWSESSVILEAFSRTHGRVALVAKGAKRPSSHFRSVLLPLQPLVLAWGGKGEVGTLKSAEWGGGHVMPIGDALLSGYYANELIMRMLARDDAHGHLFDVYAALVRVLASGDARAVLAPSLRAFELVLLRDVGYLPALDVETATLLPLRPGVGYRLVADRGLCAADPAREESLPAADWLALDRALDDAAPLAPASAAVARLDAAARSRLRHQLRAVLDYHGGAPLRTRQVALDLQRLKGVAHDA